MIRLIAAVDLKLGVANDQGIPWQLPSDKQYFREKTKGFVILMGANMYKEMDQPLPDRINMVLTRSSETLLPGFFAVNDFEGFIESHRNQDFWVVGGASL